MPYSSENLRKVKETITARRAGAVSEYERRKNALASEIPEIADIERTLSMTGTKIMSAALAHELDGETLSEIKAENIRLRALKARVLRCHGYPEDYLDIKYSCGLCHDTGYLGIDMCACMKRELVLEGFKSSGLAALLDKQSFESFSTDFYSGADRERIMRNVRLLREFAESFDGRSGESWLLLGATGLGKTHLSTAVAKVVIERGFDVVYETSQGVISAYEARRFGGDYESCLEERFLECDLLVIDDLGVEGANQFTVSCIYNIINTRINNRRSTIINTNLSQGELRERYADRITSRLFGEFKPLLFTGDDIRGQKLRKK